MDGAWVTLVPAVRPFRRGLRRIAKTPGPAPVCLLKECRHMPRWSKAMGASFRASMRSLVSRLLRDTEGNTLGIVLATTILLVSLAGSGTDMARAYMTKTSLQNACDAGVLAGRKAMATSGTYGTSETAKANKMFNFNFNPDATNANAITFSTSSTESGAVSGTASTVMPTVIMGIFGFKTINLSVECSAELQMASADVMFVLDVTGSMGCNVSGNNCSSGSDSKIVGLRSALRDFYKVVAQAVTDKSNTRVRFGFVPYDMTVNVAPLITSGAMPLSYIRDTAPYQTALAKFDTPVYVGTTGSAVTTTEIYGSNITQANCNSYGTNSWPTSGGNPVSGGGPAPAATTSTTYSYQSWTYVSGSGSSALGTCRRRRSVTTTTYALRYRFTEWTFQAATVDVSAFKGMTNVKVVSSISATARVPTAGTYDVVTLASMVGTAGVSGITTTNARWNGCVEERQTVQDPTMSPIPSGATDLDLNSAPTDDSTRWPMLFNGVTWWRGVSFPVSRTIPSSALPLPTSGSDPDRVGRTGACPAPLMQFTEVDTTAPDVVPAWLETYINNLAANGNTYHDIGMIWGGRLASPTGMFAANVTEDAVEYPAVSRHVIFMTDGEMYPHRENYSAYGIPDYENRVAPAGSTINTLITVHNNRYVAACNRVKDMGYTIWVIGFGTALNPSMTACATAGRAYFASDTTALNNTFKFIAGQVADLRINK